MKKRTLYLFGLVTLLVFPIPTIAWFYYYVGQSLPEIFQMENLGFYPIGLGILTGVVYAYLASFFMKSDVFDKSSINVEKIVRSMNLNFWDSLFISICAGVGEELLFRSGVQFYLGPIWTSIIFVAIHGYLDPRNWRTSLYGLIVMPFILVISYGFYEFGLWYCIAAHAAYDFILFRLISKTPLSEL